MLVFNAWLKNVEMGIKEQKQTNLEAVQLIKDYTTEDVRGAVEFYLDTNSTWDYQELIRHLKISIKSSKPFSSSVGNFYSHVQWPWETEDQFANELQY